jgi:hypothetical protein
MLNAAGIYMTERDRHTEDSMMMRGRYCTANSNSRIYKRLGDRHHQFATVEDVRNQSLPSKLLSTVIVPILPICFFAMLFAFIFQMH